MTKANGNAAVVDLFPKDLLLSIKPEYASAIVEGQKTVELRRKFPQDVALGSRAYIYSSSPVQAVIAIATIERVDRMPLKDLWSCHGKASCVGRDTFDEYFHGQTDGFAVILKSVKKLADPISRQSLKDLFDVIPPQSFMYLPAAFEKKIKNGRP